MEAGALTRAIHQTTLDESRWPSVIEHMAQYLGATGAYLFSALEQTGPRSFGYTYEVGADMNARYRQYYHQCDLLLQAARERGALVAGSVVNSTTLVAEPTLLQSEFYNDFMRPYGLRHAMGGILTDEQSEALGPRTHLVFWRPPGGEHFECADEQRLAALVPDLQQALTAHWKLRSRGLLGDTNEQWLAQIEQPVFILSRGGRVLYSNAAAQSLPQQYRGIGVRDGELCRGDGMTSVLSQFDALTGSIVLLPAVEPDVPALQIIPLRPAASTQSLFCWFPRAAYAVLPLTEKRSRADAIRAFAARHRLTDAESRVLALLVCGKAPKEIAEQRNLAIHTVRAHLAHIFQKTNCTNQVKLVTAVLNTPRTY